MFKYSNNTLYCYVNDTASTSTTYQTYWKQNKRNSILCTSKDGSQAFYFNGNVVQTSAQAYISYLFTSLSIGASNWGNCKIKGTIHSITFYNDFLTEEDAKGLYNRSTYNYSNKADIWLDFDRVSGLGTVADPYKTPDKSGNGKDCLLGDGSTANTIPDFLAPGMDLDGTYNYLRINNVDGVFNQPERTFVLCFSPGKSLDEISSEAYLWCQGVDDSYFRTYYKGPVTNFYIHLGASVFIILTKATLDPYWQKAKNVLIVTANDTNSSAYFNGVEIGTGSAFVPTDISILYLGAYKISTSYNFNGKIHHFSTYPFKFGKLQVKDLTNKLLRGIK
jgi:hypothetical protein